ncbi:L-lactate dehydrogenase (cytochrome) [Streptomyces sp. WMMB 714]|uniref:alpha-hydroxy acid oxidase n=1 Tax=Streptomyces sp. WMMB 714 TaxID=1286822 RepID=UPI0005F86CEF|nr:alpha-hydroxy acid oxidase [Streptomyces sp. WMMB 714]SCK31742.1 L-lactate dehydrogenase (cytochrome) [Streptomyces sp. WMMB 714]
MTTLERRFPRPRDIAPLLKMKPRQRNATARRLASAHTIWDLRRIAKRRTPAGPFDYTDGAADGEVGVRRAREAFEDLEFRPGVLRDVAHADTSATVLGGTSALPFGLAPTGFTRMMHSAGERAVAAAAEQAGVPYALSTVGTTSIEDVAAAAPSARKWFQLYLWKDRGLSRELVANAKAAGYEALLVTVDVPVNGNRLRDLRNGMTIPPQLTLRTFLDASYRWEWWLNFLTTEPYSFAFDKSGEGALTDLVSKLYDPTVTFDDLDWIRETWDGPILVKGIQTVADAEQVMAHGADGVVVSNHGGRQLDRAPVPLHLLPRIAEAVGDRGTVMLDTGIMNGGDIVAAHALGADFALVGRAYLYGLMAGGQAGVARAIEILGAEVERTMKLLGVTSVGELNPGHVRLMTRRGPVGADVLDAPGVPDGR